VIRQEVVNLLAAAFAKAGASDEGMRSMAGEFGAIEFEHRPTEEEREAALAQWRAPRGKRHLRVVKEQDGA
jgi:hypothetical protein